MDYFTLYTIIILIKMERGWSCRCRGLVCVDHCDWATRTLL